MLYVRLWFFVIGIIGIAITRKNIIGILLSIELSLLGINFLFLNVSDRLDDISGQFYRLIILTVAASESAIGLAILIAAYNIRGNVDLDFINSIKG